MFHNDSVIDDVPQRLHRAAKLERQQLADSPEVQQLKAKWDACVRGEVPASNGSLGLTHQEAREQSPTHRTRVRLDPATIERVRVDQAARVWRKANVSEVYIHRGLLWTPPIKPRRRGRTVAGDERLLTSFEFALACAVISKARVAWQTALHKEALRLGSLEIAEEQATRKEYFAKLNDHKNEGEFNGAPKPHIGRIIKNIGKRAYERHLEALKKSRKTFKRTVIVETSTWALLKAAKLDDSGKTKLEAEVAIGRLRAPVVTFRDNTEVNFKALIRSVQRKGSKLVLEVSTYWFREYAAKVVTPLPRKNSTALALYLLSIVAKDKESEGTHYAKLCKRLHLTNDKWFTKTLSTAVDALNKHNTKVGLSCIKISHVKDDFIVISKVTS